MIELKRISATSAPKALELAERYRLLNEPDQAASICRDVLAAEASNQDAARILLLALTDQFHAGGDSSLQEAEVVAEGLLSEYERVYYKGVVYERWGRSKMTQPVPAHLAGEWLVRAMSMYEAAENVRPPGDDAAILRWNACARLLNRYPKMAAEVESVRADYGD